LSFDKGITESPQETGGHSCLALTINLPAPFEAQFVRCASCSLNFRFDMTSWLRSGVVPLEVEAAVNGALTGVLTTAGIGATELAKLGYEYVNRPERGTIMPSSSSAPSTTLSLGQTSRGPMLKGSRSNGRRSGGRNNPVNRSDLASKPFKFTAVPTTVPRSGSAVWWYPYKIATTDITTSTSGVTETNFQFTLSNLSTAALTAVQTLFDVFNLAQVSVKFEALQAPGSTAACVCLHTALDFDNVASLSGQLSLLDAYSSAQEDVLMPGKSVVRSVRPCVKPLVGSSLTGLVQRTWVDTTAGSTINHYGIRSMVEETTAVLTLHVEITYWFAFRNTI